MKTTIRLHDVGDRDLFTFRLHSAGLGPVDAGDKCDLFSRCRDALTGLGIADTASSRAFFIPGRIEVLGKHTDYAGGRSILAASGRGFCMVAVDRADSMVRVVDARTDEHVKFPLHEDIMPTPGHWSAYPMTAGRRIARNFPGPLAGADIAFASDLPPAAGMSSSSAIVTGMFLVLSEVNDLVSRDEYWRHIEGGESLASYLGTIENGQSYGSLLGDGGVGTFGGSEDHTAILCCLPDTLSQYSFSPVRFERNLPMPAGYIFAIGASGVVAEKTGAALDKYNRVSRMASAIIEAWRKATGRDDPHIAAALAGYGAGAADALLKAVRKGASASGSSRRELTARLNQFMRESEYIIPSAGDALLNNDLEAFGALVDESQRNAGRMLRNQVPETLFLAKKARKYGAAAASAFGAGFGGAVWALVREDSAQEFIDTWSGHYRKAFPEAAARSSFFVTLPGPSAFEL